MHPDLAGILLDEPTIRAKVTELGSRLSEDYRDRSLIMVGILKGAVTFFADLARAIDPGLHVAFDFIAISSYGESAESSGIVRFLKDLDESIEGKDVLVVEDIVDTGLTLHYLLQNLQSRRPRSLEVCCLLDKASRRQVNVPVRYVGFTIPDQFVVGYGLDYAGRYRHLRAIGVLRPEVYRR